MVSGANDHEAVDGARRAAEEAIGRLSGETDERLSDPQLVPGSKHYATMLAFGTFEIVGGGSVLCMGVQGISGVSTAAELDRANGHVTARLTRWLTHFDWPNPSVLIEQNPYRASVGTLTGADGDRLLPGIASFEQYLILTLDGRPLINPKPLVMTAADVTRWPPLGAVFVSESATEFYPLDALERIGGLADPHAFEGADPVGVLRSCNAAALDEVSMPARLNE